MKDTWRNLTTLFSALGVAFLIGVSTLTPRPHSAPQSAGLNKAPAFRQAKTGSEKLERAIGLGEQIPVDSVAKLTRADEREEEDEGPGLTNPDGFFEFRRLQLQDEKGYIPPDGLEKARRQVALMKAAREERIKARQQAGLPTAGIYGAGIGPNAWEWIGPGNIGGRIRAILIHPTEPNKMWIGSVSGGIWRTTDGGAGWEPVNDFMANLAVTTIVIDPTNSANMYAGTGEGFWTTSPPDGFNGDGLQGGGIFKSIDGGNTWNALGFTVGNGNFSFINRLAISPDGSTILAATNSGIWRSTSGGTSWNQQTANKAVDVDFRPGDSSRAIVGDLSAARYSTDGGVTWTLATFTPAINPGTGNNGRVELAYAPSLGGAVVYASVNQNNGDVYRSADGGQNYTRVNTGNNFFLGASNQGWYDNVVWVSPLDSTFVIVGGINLWRSTDGGINFTQISNGNNNSAHSDHHVIVAHPGFNNNTNTQVFFGNDGGIYRADDVTAAVPGGSTTIPFTELNNNLGITQFYGAAGNNATQVIIGGTQDNGTLRFSGDTEGWTSMQGSDGGFCAVDQTSSIHFYGETQNLGVVRSTDGGLTSASINAGITDAGSSTPPTTNFIAPLALDPNDPNTLLAGGINLWRSTDVKAVPPAVPTWNTIKPPTGASSRISAITISPGSSSFIVVGHNDGSIFLTTNGTAGSPTWTQIDTAAVPNRMVTRLVIDNTRTPNWIYATFGGFSADNIYRTTDLGATWADVSGTGATGLPSVPVRGLTYHPDRPDLLYAGTEVGIFTSEDAGATWDVTQDGPANVSVDEIFFMGGDFPLGKVLVAVTHGRGIYRVGDVVPPPTVTTAADNGDDVSPLPGSLRQALILSHFIDSTGGPVNIRFAIPGGPGVKTINLTKPLPVIDTHVFIDGWSQGGAGYTGPPLIELNGQSVVPPSPGVKVAGLSIPAAGSGSRIRGLIINRFTGPGIVVTASNTIIEGCYIGTDAAGAARTPNEEDGIRIVNGSGNKIGMPGAGHGNLISGNGVGFGTGDGVEINGSTASGNIVQNNIIGLNAAGTAIVNNVASGVHIIGAPNTVVGGPGAETRNILSGAAVGTGSVNGQGIHIEGATATGTLITGNYIGTNAAGTADLGNNGSGILINNAPNTTIGGLTIIETGLNERNLISGNNNNAQIYITGSSATGTKIKGNYVGLNANGDARIETNGVLGIYIESNNNQIGGTTVGDGNVISGNTIGIDFAAGASSNVVQGNRIGTDKTGTLDLGNETGIQIFLGLNNLIGGTSPEARNLISGNNSAGINITGSSPNFAAGNLIQGNYIGTNAAGTAVIGTGVGGTGILLSSVKDVTIGGTAPGAGNLISGNGNSFGGNGIQIGGNPNTGIVVQGNLIGTNAAGTAALGNAGSGILIFGSAGGVTIGGASVAARNIIVANDQYGIHLNGTGGNVVKGNIIGTDITGTINWHNNLSGMFIGSPNNLIGGIAAGEANLIAFNGVNTNYKGIEVACCHTGNSLRGNSIYANAAMGIDLSPLGVTANDNCDADTGANNNQNFPVLTSAGNQGGTTLIAGTLNSNASTSFALDFYANPACDASGNGQGKTFIGSLPVTTDGSCNTSFAVTLPIAVPVGQTITATATSATGNTSEFSTCRPVTAGLNLPAGSYTNIIVNSGTTLNLAGDVTITGNLTLNGDLNTGGFTLTMPAAATSSGTGDVIGNLRRTGFTLGTPLSFGNPFNFIRFDSGTPPTEVTVNLVKSAPAGFPNAVQRTYTITPVGGSNYTATLQLHYMDGDLNGNDEATLEFWRNDGTVWAGQGATLRDAADNWIQLTGVTGFSPWVMGGPGGPTAIDLVAFTATSFDTGTLLEWQTGFEADNLGFNLYREEGGKRSRVNSQLVAGSALRAGFRSGAGEQYAWWDNAASARTSYWLEDVDLKGISTWHGPFYASVVGGAPPLRSNAELLSSLGKPGNQTAASQAGDIVAKSVTALTSGANPLAAQSAVKISIQREGFYRLTQAELGAAGLDLAVDPRRLQLFVDGNEIPMAVSTSQEGRLQALEFYGYGLDTPSTGARIYWLTAGTQLGKRIATIEAEGVSLSSPSFTTTVERRDRSLYFAALRNGERENFFGAVITSQGVDQTLGLHHLAQTEDSAVIEITLQGVTQTAHRVAVQLNGLIVGDLLFNAQQSSVGKFTIPHHILREGENHLHLLALNNAGDVSVVDRIRLAYQHPFIADDNLLRLPINGGEQVRIDGFSSNSIRVFDVTDERQITELAGKISESNQGYAISVTAPEKSQRQLFALTAERALSADSVKQNQASSLRSKTNAADLLMVSSRSLFSALQPLRIARQAEGYRVALVDVEDIYDEFSFGHKSPQSLKDFFAYASANWQGKPRFVLFAGDASYDARDYLRLGDNDIVPTRLLDTDYLETASDDWLVDFNNDGVPELVTGRLPARTVKEASAMVNKLLRYSPSFATPSALLVSDANDGFNFEQASAQLRQLLPNGWRVEELQRGRLDPAKAKAQLFDALKRGQRLVNYVGHGSLNLWRGDLLSASEAVQLENQRLPVVVIMNCLNGYFQDAMQEALGEALLKAESGGAVAVWASSGLTLPQEQAAMNQEFYKQLFSARSLSLGEAVVAAKRAIRNADVRRTWILFGDPTMKLK